MRKYIDPAKIHMQKMWAHVDTEKERYAQTLRFLQGPKLEQKENIPQGICQCGCGQKTELITRSRPERNEVRGRYFPFVKLHGYHEGKPRVAVDKDTGCWIWTGAITVLGYGFFKGMAAHLYVYKCVMGKIPRGLDLDHACHTRDKSCPGGRLCRHRRCVNPYHLEPVTRKVNIRRSVITKLTFSEFSRAEWMKAQGYTPGEILTLFPFMIRTGLKAAINKQRWKLGTEEER